MTATWGLAWMLKLGWQYSADDMSAAAENMLSRCTHQNGSKTIHKVSTHGACRLDYFNAYDVQSQIIYQKH